MDSFILAPRVGLEKELAKSSTCAESATCLYGLMPSAKNSFSSLTERNRIFIENFFIIFANIIESDIIRAIKNERG